MGELDFLVSAGTNTGIRKAVNQDSVFVRRLVTEHGKYAFAILCDGMGGLQYGEIASAHVVTAFKDWIYERFPKFFGAKLNESIIQEEWAKLIAAQHNSLRKIGEQMKCRLGTTVTALLLSESRYYLLNIGDSRAYEINRVRVLQLTTDHTVAAQEVAKGNMTPEQAEHSRARGVLTKCVGTGKLSIPDFFFGTPQPDTLYLLCSDGFRHVVDAEEIRASLYDPMCTGATELRQRVEYLIDLNKQRGETDNISAITIHCRAVEM